jgi:WD40 repeat protein
MTDQDLEQRLRGWYLAEINDTEGAPQQLRTDLTTIRGTAARSRRFVRGWGFPSIYRIAPLALAATALVVAILIGIGLLVRSPNIGPSPVPGPTHSSTPQPTTHRASAAWTATGSMTGGRSQPSATVLNDGKVLVAGGFGELGGTTSAELYDPASGIWNTTGNMLTADYGFAATLLADGKVLVVHNSSYGTAELYDPASGTWTATGKMVTGHAWETATLLPNGRVLVAGDNYNPGVDPVSAELYDPASRTWTATGGMVAPRVVHTATLLPDGRVLVAGGAAGADFKTRLATAELYDPASGTWTATGNMAVARGNSSQAFTVTLLPDGRVLAVGGQSQNGTGALEASAELYDPNGGTWSLAGSMSDGRTGQTATLLRNGRVLVTGGFSGPASDPTASAELYDPNSRPLVDFGIGSWSVTASMAEARYGHMAIPLRNGTILVIGGFGKQIFNPDTQQYDRPVLSSVELYDPGSGN